MGRPRVIFRGEVYSVDLGRPVGHEPAFRRPAVIVSVDILSNGPGGCVIVVPVTTTGYGLRSHIEMDPGSSGLHHTSFARCDQLRVVSVQRLETRHGVVGLETMARIDQALRFVLDL